MLRDVRRDRVWHEADKALTGRDPASISPGVTHLLAKPYAAEVVLSALAEVLETNRAK